MSKHIARRVPACNNTNDAPDLFTWRAAVIHRHASHAGQYAMRRYGVPHHTVEVIVALAGLGMGAAR
jgi:hypothetical protein